MQHSFAPKTTTIRTKPHSGRESILAAVKDTVMEFNERAPGPCGFQAQLK